MTCRSIAASLLLAFLLVASWSVAVCETSCVLPHAGHACCAAEIGGTRAHLAASESCGVPVHAIAGVQISPTAAVSVIPAASSTLAPAVFVTDSVSRSIPVAASPPKFHLRI